MLFAFNKGKYMLFLRSGISYGYDEALFNFVFVPYEVGNIGIVVRLDICK